MTEVKHTIYLKFISVLKCIVLCCEFFFFSMYYEMVLYCFNIFQFLLGQMFYCHNSIEKKIRIGLLCKSIKHFFLIT